ncbi:hypothetical protein LYNGBM3L_49930 [Moorena producens 3L]|uniref:Uncharacterized protein n=1 Tax=Moorena producens 3L TaxID=489825 RepID=F4XY19_9CYAN|nr:hypothetical protein LYNGBM3L_49930 [Moorena producens 3L]
MIYRFRSIGFDLSVDLGRLSLPRFIGIIDQLFELLICISYP